MNIFTLCIIVIVVIFGSLLVIDQYKALSTAPKRPKKPKKPTLPKGGKVFRPPKWRFILIEAAIIGVGGIIGISFIEWFHPPRYSSPYRFIVGFVGIRILMRLFWPLDKVDDLMLIISPEGVTSTLLPRRITFPIHEIDQEIGTTAPNETNETNKWVIYRYMKAIQRKIEQWLGNEYIYSVDGKRIELSPLFFKREQINEILNEVENVTKAFANNQEHATKTDIAD